MLVSPLLRKYDEMWFWTVSGVRSSGLSLLTDNMRSVELIYLPVLLVEVTVFLIRSSSAIESEPSLGIYLKLRSFLVIALARWLLGSGAPRLFIFKSLI